MMSPISAGTRWPTTWRRTMFGEMQAIGRGVRSLVRYHERQDALSARHPLHDHILAKIKEKRANFTGREWLFRRVLEWLHDPMAPRTLVLTGDAGVGKSAFSSYMAAPLKNFPSIPSSGFDAPSA